ncbi:MAG: DEAD/DEAH box helicase [Candidatus Omnitrophota bacterium]|nr:DEAD/DEAH box helicase [Candidatus Omnitrophota bacterium]
MNTPTAVFQSEKVGDLVRDLHNDPRKTAFRLLERQPAEYADYPDAMDPALVAALRGRGIEKLYTHQRAAVDAVLSGKNIVTVTPTASGKTLCYNLPVIDSILKQSSTRALYLFPTKALAQDQMDEIHSLSSQLETDIRCFTYDGDTPQDARKAIRGHAHIVVSNPDMLHQGILPHHTKWIEFFENLRFVVIDEMHYYRGVFGSHLANLIRRLKRIASFYRAKPLFLLSSATIANPEELARDLIEQDVELINESGAPRGRKFFFFVNPPIVDKNLGIRANSLQVARSVAKKAITRDLQTISFTTSRLNVEVLSKYLKDDFEKKIQDKGRIRGYRGGYLPNTRREIEKGLRDGEVRGVVSTNALELGIDIGGLDVSVLAGYPGTVASTWQQAGRAGRKTTESVAVLVARSNPLDQYIINHPTYFFGASPEYGLINSDNLSILMSHIKCAAFELPFCDGESFGKENLIELLQYLENEKVLRHSGDKWHWMNDAYPADQVSLRSANPDNVVIFDMDQGNKPVAEVDLPSAPFMVHKDAIYMLEQTPYIVDRLDFAEKKAFIRKADGIYYTEAIDSTNVRILDIFASRDDASSLTEHGEVHVLTHISGFKKIKFYTLENLGYGKIDLPDQEMHTTAYWFTIAGTVLKDLNLTRSEIVDGLLGTSYALHHMATLLLMCDFRDINRSVGDRQAKWFMTQSYGHRGSYTEAVAEDGVQVDLDGVELFEPTLFIYENYPGGVGFSPVLFEHHGDLLKEARNLIAACPCQEGCPSCVGPILRPGSESKRLSLGILHALLEPLSS